jgi:hypothetical protein
LVEGIKPSYFQGEHQTRCSPFFYYKNKGRPKFYMETAYSFKNYLRGKLFGVADCTHFADDRNFNLTWISHFILNTFGNIE